MGRQRKSGLDEVASWPWPLGILAGILAFLLIRYGIGTWFSAAGGSLLGPLGQQIGGTMAPLAWFALLACWIAAGVSWLRARQRRSLHDTRSDLDSLTNISWREFEMLVGESFRRQGFEVVETGLGGKDGGIDLVVSKDGRRELVQCKQWKRRHVGAATVREMWGLVDHHGADAVHIVSLGDFTPDAARFAVGKPIHLVTGRDLFKWIRSAQAGAGVAPAQTAQTAQTAQAGDPPSCPICAGAMLLRHNRRTREPFLGCARFPHCRGTTAATA